MSRFVDRFDSIVWMAVVSALLIAAAVISAILGFFPLAQILVLAGIGAGLLNLAADVR